MPNQPPNENKPLSHKASRLTKAERWANLSTTGLLLLYRLARLGQWIWSIFNDLQI
jgi:hypothetical protein